jgi:putative acyl-CoA dehydrogenase
MSTTHEVLNQSEPLLDWNVYASDLALTDAVNFLVNGAPSPSETLGSFGEHIGSTAYAAAANQANQQGPKVHNFDSRGRRLDVVEFHPAYHQLMQTCAEHGLAAAPWAKTASANAHLIRGAKFMMHSGIESGVLCPISMSYAVVPALQSQPDLLAQTLPKLTALAYDPRPIAWQRKASMTMGMGMTEKQGGSDVRANTTKAVPSATHQGQWQLTGHKWFFSAPMCDAFLVLAQVEPETKKDSEPSPTQHAGSSGLSCFFVPSYLDNGSDSSPRNAIQIQRLKDKLGNRSNASSEVEFNAASAWLVGPVGKGINTILEMGTMTRIDCALGTAGLMRQALSLAIDHCAQRKAFGTALIEQPMMQQVLADMALESEAATLLALRIAASLDRTNEQSKSDTKVNDFETALRRIATPAAKFWICKRGALFAQEAMECLGGNGYVEEGMMARIYREMPLNSIWEGAGNIMGLDILRSLKKSATSDSGQSNAPTPALTALKQEIAPSLGKHQHYDRFVERWFLQFDNLALGQQSPLQESNARQLATEIALLLQAHLMAQISPSFVFEAFCDSRFNYNGAMRAPASFGSQATSNADLILARARPKH